MFMIMLVLDDSDHLDAILEAWAGLGVSGVTIIESSGMHRRKLKHIPMRYLYGGKAVEEFGNLNLIVIVKNEPLIRQCLKAVEEIVRDLNQPNTGVFAAWPLTLTKGIPQE